jgi:prepilin-type N-terminal cleavage/methylation domain-containing protein
MKTDKATQGFTLMELVIALAIVAILSGGVLVAVGGRSGERRNLHNASVQLQADIRYAQRRAIVEGQRYGIEFNFEQNYYRVVRNNPREVLRTVELPNGITFRLAANHNAATHQLSYLPRGTVSGHRNIEIESESYSQVLRMSMGGGRASLDEILPKNDN